MSLSLEEADSLELSQEDIDALLALELQFADRSPPNGPVGLPFRPLISTQRPQSASGGSTLLDRNAPPSMSLRDFADSVGVDPRDPSTYPAMTLNRALDNTSSSGSQFQTTRTSPPYPESAATNDAPASRSQSNTGPPSRIMRLADWHPEPLDRPSRPLRVTNPDSTAPSDDETCEELRREPVVQPGDRSTSQPQNANADNAQTPRATDEPDPTGSGEATPRLRPISRPRVQFTEIPIVHEDQDADADARERERRCKLARSALDDNITYLCQRLDACLDDQKLQIEDAVSVSSWVENAQDQDEDEDDKTAETASPGSLASDASYDVVSDAEDWDHVSNDLSESENDTEDSDHEFVLPFRGRTAEQKKRKASSEYEQQQSAHQPRASAYDRELKRFKEPVTPTLREIYREEPDIHPDELAQLREAIHLSLFRPPQPMLIRDSISETERFRRNQIIEATRRGDPTNVNIGLYSLDQERDRLPPAVIKAIAKHLFFPDYFNLALSCRSFYKTLDQSWGLGVSKQEYHRTLVKESFTPLPTKETLPKIQSTFCDVCLYRLPLNYFKLDVYEMLSHRVNHFDSDHFEPTLKNPADMRLVVCADCEGTRVREQRQREVNRRFESTSTGVQATASGERWKPRNMEPSPCVDCQVRDKKNGVCLQHNFKGLAPMGPVWRPSERVYLDGSKRDGLWYRDRS